MDVSYIIADRLAVGGGIWTAAEMATMAEAGFTHIINLQAEFDHSALATAAGMRVLWNPTLDDLMPKTKAFFERTVEFALAALADEDARLYVHCAAGVHRGPLATAAILCALGYTPEAAMQAISERRSWAEFPAVYATSLRNWAKRRGKKRKPRPAEAGR